MSDYSGDKFYKKAKEEQDRFRKSEKQLDTDYRKRIKEESEQEGLNR